MGGGDIILIYLVFAAAAAAAANVTYDSRALVIDGHRKVLISGSIHYPRSTPDMWPSLIQKSKDGGLDVIETYVFWDIHETSRNRYDFSGRKDLVKFIKLVQEAGLYVFLRIGPYVCAEWNYGGFPVWLHFVKDIKLRTDNEPYKALMQQFVSLIVDMMKKNNLFASQGGPIILSQIENEYGNIEGPYGDAGKKYVEWAANMAVSLNTGVPWVMCQQGDAPDIVINTCNGFYCDQFTPNSPKSPKIWTENWSGWFLGWGGAVPYRPTEDLAFAVARFYQRGGTFQNYYMYHGGTNFARTSGGPFIATSYDYDAPLDEYGLENQPKWGHLKDLHKAIKLCEPAMVATNPAHGTPATNVEVTEYKTNSGLCSAFLANIDSKSDATVHYNGNSYHVPAWSVSILPDCKNVVLNTAQINSVATVPKFYSLSLTHSKQATNGFGSGWHWNHEPIGISSPNAFTQPKLLEQLSTTADKTDYLWYSTSTSISGNEPFIQNGSQTNLHVESDGHVLYAFVNGKLAGSGKGNNGNAKVSVHLPVTLVQGSNQIDLLSLTVGLQNYGSFFDLSPAGIGTHGSVKLEGGNSILDLSSQLWKYQIGLKGEGLGHPSADFPTIKRKKHKGPLDWLSGPVLPKNQPLIWYKTQIDAPPGTDPVAIDFTGMGKGYAWINGQNIGRYWPAYTATNDGCSQCDYRGPYDASKCRKGCGKPSQQLNHVPRSWLKPIGNTLVLLEEMGGDPTKLSFATRQIKSLCSHVSETHSQPVELWHSDKKRDRHPDPVLLLKCPSPRQVISSIKFASFGNPEGTCGSFSHGECSSSQTLSIVQKACVGKMRCRINVSTNTFGDPCAGVRKSLAVEAICS